MAWRPDYKRDVCERLRRAAGYIRTGPPQHALLHAAVAIHVLMDDEFPADFRTQFREIIAEVTSGGGSIEDTVTTLPDDRVIALGDKIVELYEDTCN